MYIKDEIFQMYQRFTEKYCPNNGKNKYVSKMWCNDCKYYDGKCTHPSHPKIPLWSKKEEIESE